MITDNTLRPYHVGQVFSPSKYENNVIITCIIDTDRGLFVRFNDRHGDFKVRKDNSIHLDSGFTVLFPDGTVKEKSSNCTLN